MYNDMFRLVRDVRAAPGKISRYRDQAVADDAIEAGYLIADLEGRLTVTPAGEKAFAERSE
jgi:hypothetical protein